MGKRALPVSLYRHAFRYRQGRLFCEAVPVERIVARVGTPVYIYSRATFLEHYWKLKRELRRLIP